VARRKLPTAPPAKFRAGDWVVQNWGGYRVPVLILEDVGPVGWRGVRYYRYLKPDPYADPVESETTEDELEPARPDEVAAGQAAAARGG
jgi:hypothetical protein